MRWILMLLCGLIVSLGVAHGEDFTCGNATKLHQYHHAVDPTQVPGCPVDSVLAEIPEAQIPAQRQLHDAHARAGTLRYLKVVDGLMVEMTQAEKDAVDVPLNTKKQATDIANQEIKTNEVCANNTLQEISAYWKEVGRQPPSKQAQLQTTIQTLDTAIAAVATGPAKTALLAVRDALTTHMTMFINDSELAWRYLCSRTFLKP